MDAIRFWNIADNFIRRGVDDHDVRTMRNVQTVIARIGDQDVPAAFAPDLDLVELVVAAFKAKAAEQTSVTITAVNKIEMSLCFEFVIVGLFIVITVT